MPHRAHSMELKWGYYISLSRFQLPPGATTETILQFTDRSQLHSEMGVCSNTWGGVVNNPSWDFHLLRKCPLQMPAILFLGISLVCECSLMLRFCRTLETSLVTSSSPAPSSSVSHQTQGTVSQGPHLVLLTIVSQASQPCWAPRL